VKSRALIPLLLCLPSAAWGQAYPPPPPAPPPPAYRLTVTRAPKEPGIALGLSLGGTLLVPIVGPSLGQIYAEEYGHAALFSGLRLGAAVVGVAGFVEIIADIDGDIGDAERGLALLALGGAALTLFTVYDVVDAPFAAQRANARFGLAPPLAARAPSLVLSPTPLPSPPGGAGFGLSLLGRF
jgi:hypothetical protein